MRHYDANGLTRRDLLLASAVGVGSATLPLTGTAAAGRSTELPGANRRPQAQPIQPIQAKQFKPSIFEMDGISRRTTEAHLRLYNGYVSKTNEILTRLQGADLGAANATYSDLRELKVELSFAWLGVKNHEIYYDHLGGPGGNPTGPVAEAINRAFGSYDAFKAEMKATGLAGRGWVWLAWDYDLKRLFNWIGDSQNLFPIWNATPIMALDVFEHAYFIDYDTNRGAYIDAFFRNLDWDAINRRWLMAAAMEAATQGK